MKIIWALWIVSFSFIVAATTSEEHNEIEDEASIIVAESITPIHYYLKITPYMNTGDGKAFTFDGKVNITFKTNELDVKRLVFNSKQLDFTKADCQILPGDVSVVGLMFDEYNEVAILNFDKTLHHSKEYELTITYRGVIQNETTGFYRSSYVENGETKYLAMTYFGPSHARTAFPCFDDTIYKTKFTVSIKCPKKYTCLSNMPINTSKNHLVTFHKTPQMPTYLLSFIISQFVVLQESSNGLQNLKIWGKLEDKESTKLAYDYATAMLSSMSQYTDINYYDIDKNKKRRMKLDIVVVPEMEYSGADSWGLSLLSYNYLLYNTEQWGVEDRTTVIASIGHQMCHMWFENLVSFNNITDLFLMEGLSNYFSYYFTNMRQPQDGMDDYMCTEFFRDFNSDTSPDKNVLMTYETLVGKAFALVRMIHSWIGEVAFQKGIKNYINQNKYIGSTPDDLYTAWQKAAEEDSVPNNTFIPVVMHSWSDNSGFPMIIVKMNHENGHIEFSQKQFLETNETSDRVYYVPISFTCEKGGNFSDVQPKFILGDTVYKSYCEPKSDWVILNMQLNGYYRINYDEETWNMIIKTLNTDHTKIPKYIRAQLIDDATNLLTYGYMKPKMYANLFKYLKAEKDFIPMYTAYLAINNIKIKLYRLEPVKFSRFSLIQKFMLQVLEAHWNDLTLNTTNESYSKKMFRIYINRILCELNDSRCIKKYKKIFNDMRTENKHIEADLKETVYCTAVKHGDEEDFDYLVFLLKTAKSASEREVIFSAMACTSKPNKLVDFYNKTINENTIVKNYIEKRTIISYLVRHEYPENVQAMFNYMKINILHIYDTCGEDYVDIMFRTFVTNMNINHLYQFKLMLQNSEEFIKNASEGKDEVSDFTREYRLGMDNLLKLNEYVKEEIKNKA